MFVGEDRGLRPLLPEGGQKLAGTRQQPDVIEHRRIPIRPVDGEGRSHPLGSRQPADGHLEAAADRRAHLGRGRGREAQLPQGVGMGALDGGKVVDERAVEVEEYSAVAHGEAGRIAGAAPPASLKQPAAAIPRRRWKKYLVNIPRSSEIGRE